MYRAGGSRGRISIPALAKPPVMPLRAEMVCLMAFHSRAIIIDPGGSIYLIDEWNSSTG